MSGWYVLLGVAVALLCTSIYFAFFSKSENNK